MSHASFRAASIKTTGFQAAQVGSADFTGAELSNVDVRAADFRQAKFVGAELGIECSTGANFESAILTMSDPRRSTWNKKAAGECKELTEKEIVNAVPDEKLRGSALERLRKFPGVPAQFQYAIIEKVVCCSGDAILDALSNVVALSNLREYCGIERQFVPFNCALLPNHSAYDSELSNLLAETACENQYSAARIAERIIPTSENKTLHSVSIEKHMLNWKCKGGRGLSEEKKAALRQIAARATSAE